MRVSDFIYFQQMEQHALCIRSVTTLKEMPSVICDSYGKIIGHLRELNEMICGIPYVCYKNYRQMTPERMEVVVGFPVAGALPGTQGIDALRISRRKVVFAMHRGDYDQLESLYNEMEQWLAFHELQPVGDAFEYYYNGTDSFAPDEMLTKVLLPVAPLSTSEAG